MLLPVYYVDIIHGGLVTMYRGGCFEVPLVSFSKCSGRFSNVLLITVNHVTSRPVYYITFVLCGVFVLGTNKYVLDGSVVCEVKLMQYLPHIPLMLSQIPFTYGVIMYPLYVLLFLVSLGLFC